MSFTRLAEIYSWVSMVVSNSIKVMMLASQVCFKRLRYVNSVLERYYTLILYILHVIST